jgi:hypothetical protein
MYLVLFLLGVSASVAYWLRVPGCRTELYCVSCEVRTEFICYVEESRPPLWSSGESSWLQNGDVLCFLWGTNWIYVCSVEESRPPLWYSGHSSWLHNGDVLCFLWGTNWIYVCSVEESRPPLWSSGQRTFSRTVMYCVSCEGWTKFIYAMLKKVDRLCGLVVRVPGYRSICPGSIPGAIRFSEK